MSCEDMVAVLRDAGLEVRDQPVLPSALGLPDSARVRLLVDHEGLFHVYCAENLPSTLPVAGVKGKLKAARDEALLLLDRGGERFVALHTTAEGDDAQVELNRAEALRLLPNVRVEEGEDPYDVSERVRDLILHPEEERKPYLNRGLFSEDYLDYRLTDPLQYPEWREDISRAYGKLRDLYESKKQLLDGLNEAQTESEFLDEALDVLGYSFIKQTRARDGSRPDYALFADPRTKDEALRVQDDPTRLYAATLAVGEGKYWGRSLDVYTKRDDRDNEATASQKSAPGMQISRYLQETDLPWGILTNGSEWRLYYGGAPGKTERYYSVDLVRALQNEDDFRRFYLFFRRDAFVQRGAEGKTFLDRVLTGSEDYAIRVGKELKKVIFERLFARLAAGFLEDHTRRNGQPVDEETLKKTYRGTLALLYRLLFLLYAEARDLLPHRDRLGYGRHSITRLKKDVAEGMDEGERYAGNSYVIWERLESLFRIVDDGSTELNVPPYNGGLFKDAGSHEFLGTHRVSDRHLAPALDELSRQPDETDKKRFVDYAFIGVRELGSVYEGLLEFSLRIAERNLVVVKEKGKEVYVPKGSQGRKRVLASVKKSEPYLVNDKKERKATGTYYTPRYIVDYIVENTLGPLVQERRTALEERLAEIARLQSDLRRMRKNEDYIASEVRKMEPLKTLLDVKVLDPAMGSGHFLVAAVDYLTDEFSTIISELDAEPVVEELADLRTEIRASLEAYGASATDEQLSDANLLKRMVLKRCVYGVDLNEMAVELAKLSLWLDAFTVGAPLSFLDHHLKHGNSLIGSSVREVRREVETSGSLLGNQFTATLIQGTELMQHVGEIPDATEGEVRESIDAYARADRVLTPYKRMLDIWTSKHFGNSGAERFLSVASSTGDVDYLTRGDYAHFTGRDKETIDTAINLSDDKHFFHWELEFPEVFYEGARERRNPGFDAVVGNPPYANAWAMTSLDANTRSAIQASSRTKGLLTGHWDLYAAFIARSLGILQRSGFHSFIVPDALLREKYARGLREHLLRDERLLKLMHFEGINVFEDVSRHTVIYVVQRGEPTDDAETQMLTPLTPGDRESELGRMPQHSWLEFEGTQIRVGPNMLQRQALLREIAANALKVGDFCYVGVGATTHSKDGTSFKKDTIVTDYPVGNAKRFFDGANLGRYSLRWDGRYLDYRRDEMYGPRVPELFESQKIVVRDVTGPDERLLASFDARGLYCDHLITCVTYYENIEGSGAQTRFHGYTRVSPPYPDLLYVTGILGSRLMSWYFQEVFATGTLQGSYSHTYPQQIRAFPVRLISFTTPADEREQLSVKGREVYMQFCITGDAAGVLDFVNRHLSRLPGGKPDIAGEHSDIVHDLLSYLAGEMIATHEREAEVEQRWQEWVEAAIPNQHKLTKKFRQRGWVELGLEQGWDGVRAEFQARNAIPTGKDLQRLKRETEEALAELRPLYERIRETDELIDQIVYRLYGLTEEEISVVEASAKGD